MTRREYIQIFIDRVLNWDTNDILELADLLYDLDHSIRFVWDAPMDRWEYTGEFMPDYLELSQIPTRPIPVDISGNTPIWAMDKQGNCLIRMDFDSTNHGHYFQHMIRHIDQLRIK
jgi:hypothetical protein